MKMKQNEFFGLNNYRPVKKCCRNCKHVKLLIGLGGNYLYCNHPDIKQLEVPSPISESDICDAFEIANSET